MPEQIILEGNKEAIFLGACTIYGAYLRRLGGRVDESKLQAKAVSDAIVLAQRVTDATCSGAEVCDGKELW